MRPFSELAARFMALATVLCELVLLLCAPAAGLRELVMEATEPAATNEKNATGRWKSARAS
eukprot:237134-Alexandrium_andersonii.AAC.1